MDNSYVMSTSMKHFHVLFIILLITQFITWGLTHTSATSASLPTPIDAISAPQIIGGTPAQDNDKISGYAHI